MTGNKLNISPDVLKLAEACEYEEGHTLQVTALAAKLFDELSVVHGLPKEARKYLVAAAVLHDIGWVRGASGHHKSSYELIIENRPPSLSPEEAELVGQIARYHRKALPKLDHEPFARLNQKDRELVRALAAILRVADGMDRGHASKVSGLVCEIDATRVTIQLETQGPAELEIWGAMRKSDLFEDVFGRQLSIKPKT